MRIEMKATGAGPAGVMERGKVYNVADDKAQDMIKGGYAVAVGSGEKVRVSQPQVSDMPTRGRGRPRNE